MYNSYGNLSEQRVDYSKENHNYDYPEGLDLRPSSDLHKSLRDKILHRANESRTEISKRFKSWREIDRTLTIYTTPEDHEVIEKAKEPKRPISIIFPYTYSMLEALLTYLSMAFFQSPMFQYEGVEDDDTIGAMLMEMIIDLHVKKSKVALNIHTALRDSLAYGVGIAIPGWRKVYGRRPVKSTITEDSIFGPIEKQEVTMQTDLLYEGNDLSNIDPYMWLPDPGVSSVDIQSGEFVGWLDRTNYLNLLSLENEEGSELFNVKYLKLKKDRRSSLALDQSDRQIKHGGSNDLHRSGSEIVSPVDVIKMYVNIIPKEWKLGPGEYPEKWYFELASDDVIIKCQKADHNHGMFPIAIASPEYDGYSITPISRMEVLYGLQHTLDFLFNNHIENLKKSVNDMFVVDPSLININDMLDPKPGKLIRLRRSAWGRGVDKVVQQLDVRDITRANISDSAYITQWMDRISGADQSMQGALRMTGPERLTSSEFQGTRGSAISRLQRMAMIIGIQFMQDIGTMFATHTQQYMSHSTYVSVTGRHVDRLKKTFNKERIQVSPYDLIVNYDLIIKDGSIPGGNFSPVWVELFKVIGTNPELMAKFDVARIFTYIARQLGAKNVEDFMRVETQTMPDADIASQAQAGNIVPLGG